jgi:four helix bundle protein
MQDYTRLLVWQKARTLTMTVNLVSRPFRPGDTPGLRSQLMRATMSISATMAEGAGRASRPDFARFVTMAITSASEVEHHLRTASDLGVIGEDAHRKALERCIEVRRMLFGLRKSLLEAEANQHQPRARATRRVESD